VLYLVSGKEEFLREEFVGQLKTLMHKLPMGEHNVDELGPGAPIRDVVAACSVVPFLCEKRMVIARGVVSGAGRARGRARRTTTEAPSAPVDELIAYLPHLPPSTHLVLVEEEPGSFQACAAARPDAVKRDFPRLREDALPRWIIDRASKHAARVSVRAATELAHLIGSELRALDSEIEKLACYVEMGTAIDVEDVSQLVAGAGPSIFAFLDAVAERRPAPALAAAHSLLDRGDDPAELLAQLAALIRRLLVVKELASESRPLQREAPTFGLTSSSYALQKLQRQAARLPVVELERAYTLLSDADLAVKTGRMDPELVIELVVATLVGIVSSGMLLTARSLPPRLALDPLASAS